MRWNRQPPTMTWLAKWSDARIAARDGRGAEEIIERRGGDEACLLANPQGSTPNYNIVLIVQDEPRVRMFAPETVTGEG